MIFTTIMKALKPFHLISLVMTYLLGAGLVYYVQEIKSWAVFIQGGIFLLLISLSIELMCLLHALTNPRKWVDGMTYAAARKVRLIIGAIVATFLTVATTVMIGWMQAEVLWQGLVFLLVATLTAGGLLYASRVYEKLRILELIFEVLLFVVIPPAMGYFLQSEDMYRLLTMAVLASVPSYLAYRLLCYLETFGHDQQFEIETMVTQIGWERAMLYHNAFILLTYLLYALIALLGFPWFLIWPVFLTLPIGLLEIFLMERVRRGVKPLWRVMRFATACVFFIPIYLIGSAFWLR